MYYIFFINNIELEKKFWTAQEIMNFLLGNNKWAFSVNAPNMRYFKEGVKVIVYLAGKGNRFFAADFIIASKTFESGLEPNAPEWLTMFPVRINIRNVTIWEEPLGISDVIDELSFIEDKKNYGLYFRQSSREIKEKDYITIIDNQRAKH